MVQQPERSDPVGELKFSPDGRLLVMGYNDGHVDVIDASSLKLVGASIAAEFLYSTLYFIVILYIHVYHR